MKTTLIRISKTNPGMHYIGIGIGFEYQKGSTKVNYGWFGGIAIEFLCWIVRIGIDRERE